MHATESARLFANDEILFPEEDSAGCVNRHAVNLSSCHDVGRCR